jgi:hypothetical protein
MGYAYENKMTIPFTLRTDGADRMCSLSAAALQGLQQEYAQLFRFPGSAHV